MAEPRLNAHLGVTSAADGATIGQEIDENVSGDRVGAA